MPTVLISPKDSFDPAGLIAAKRLTNMLHITRDERAATQGLSRDAVLKGARLGRPPTRARLRDMVEILNRVRPWAASGHEAFAWYRSRPLSSFCD
ncbi:XRE family transcriptional regulator [Komagataeibacter europaeus]|nr:XRE family transcriptional regulator [Komagataeibacter europaeus]